MTESKFAHHKCKYLINYVSTLAIKKRTSVETFLNHSTFLLAQFNHKFNLNKLPVFGFKFQCLVLAQN